VILIGAISMKRVGASQIAAAVVSFAAACSLGCGDTGTGGAGGAPASSAATGLPPPTHAAVVLKSPPDTRFETAPHMLASIEMQLSGEPFAEAMGRDLAGYSRDFPVPNVYWGDDGNPQIDLPGFAAAIESYEYSKQPMNLLALESGAGTSLAFGPLVNPSGATGAAALALLGAKIQAFAVATNAEPAFVQQVDGTDPTNRLGWPGLWPTLQPFRSFDPTIHPVNSVDRQCSISSDDDPGSAGRIINHDYECDANSLHLADRAAQVEPVISPGATGWAAWKYALWITNYLQSMHDAAGMPVAEVAEGDVASVGLPGNAVVATDPPGAAPGTYLGSSDIEGFQAAVMIEELDDAAEEWLTRLGTSDGETLAGFATAADALAYDYVVPPRWFPAAVTVTEADDPSGFPRPAGYSISDPASRLMDLLGMAGAYATLYALTDRDDAAVGGSQTARAYFDGDPFADDDQSADGESSLHDRALAMLRVVVVDIDRLHRDPASGRLVDVVSVENGAPSRGKTIDTVSVAYSIVALRTVRRALTSNLALYGDTTPDTVTAGMVTPLDDPAIPLAGAPGGDTVLDRVTALIDAQAELLLDGLTDADGRAREGWDFAAGAPTSEDESIDAQAAAVRGLLAAYLATSDTRYRDRARLVFERMDAAFYDPLARLYTGTPKASAVSYTPLRFALVESALRDMYELVAAQPGQEELAARIEDRFARLVKLVLDGWDDLSGDGIVEYDEECFTEATFDWPNGPHPLGRGGLQMAERSLSGEIGSVCENIDPHACLQAGLSPTRQYTPDRNANCVPEVSAVGLPAALAREITFEIGAPEVAGP
jgi:hypothetical protein